ncbi:MAG: 3-keto-5-aminohexanoate cleavage protein [Candidatus Korobacteraceae bacterium]|jgi:3-keto-5-aminohexanoate cleavage enzyme
MDFTWSYCNPHEYMRRVSKGEMPPLIISVALSGAAGKENNPNVPESNEEQAQQAYESYLAGAACVHVHAKTEDGEEGGVADAALYRDLNRRIRALCPEIVIGNSTGTGHNVPREEVINILDADGEMVSINLGPFGVRKLLKKREPPLKGRPADVLLDTVFPITVGEQEAIARKALCKGIKVELEVHHIAQLSNFQNLISQELVRKPYWTQLIFGPNHEPPTLACFSAMLSCLPPDSMFSMIGLGPYQLPMITMAILLGGHVRVGMEDNVFYRRDELAKSNAQFVERVVRIAKELDRDIATPAQAREMLGLSATPRQY